MSTDLILAFLLGGAITTLAVMAFVIKKRSRVQSSHSLPGDDPATKLISADNLPSGQHVGSIILGDPSDPDIEISQFDLVKTSSLTPVKLPPESLSRLSNVLQGVPSLGGNLATTASQNLVSMKVSPKLAKGLAEGDYKIMHSLEGGFRGNVVDGKTGKVVGQARFKDMGKLRKVAAAAAIWQLVSVAVAQQHMASINQNLKEIENVVRDIKNWLEDERLGKLEGNLSYLRTIAAALQEGHLCEKDLDCYRNNIEDVERECLQIIAAQDKALRRFKQNLPETKLPNIFGTDEDTNAVQNQIHEFEKTVKPLYLALYVRAAACQILMALPGTKPVVRKRLEELNQFNRYLESVSEVKPEFNKLIEKIDSLFNREKTLQERRKSLQIGVCEALEYSEDMRISIGSFLMKAEKRLELSDIPLEIIVERDKEDNVISILTLRQDQEKVAVSS